MDEDADVGDVGGDLRGGARRRDHVVEVGGEDSEMPTSPPRVVTSSEADLGLGGQPVVGQLGLGAEHSGGGGVPDHAAGEVDVDVAGVAGW